MREQEAERAARGTTFQAPVPLGLPASIGVPLRSPWLEISGLC